MQDAHRYAEDLAFVHEAGFAYLAEAAARDLSGRVRPPGLIVDLGCGGGTLLAHMVRQGFAAWGVDASADMVALARRRVPEGEFVVASAGEVDLPSACAVTAIGEVLNHVAADHGVPVLAAIWHAVHDALAPGGVLLFDAATTERPLGRTTAQRAARGWRMEAVGECDGTTLVRTIDVWRDAGGPTRHAREVHRLPLLDADALVADLRAAGFEVERLGGYDDHPFQEGWEGFAARRT